MGILLNHIWKSVLTEFEIWVDSKVLRSEQKIMNQFIAPFQK
jgi:hypothetical protein